VGVVAADRTRLLQGSQAAVAGRKAEADARKFGTVRRPSCCSSPAGGTRVKGTAAHLDRWLRLEHISVGCCGRALLQKGESEDKLPTTFVMKVCPSHRRFQPISADIERSRKLSKEARFRALKAVARVRIPPGAQLWCYKT
jgi:hypothetical protein